MYLLGSMPWVSIMTSPSEDGEEEEEEEEGGESFHRPRRALNITPPPAPRMPLLVMVEGEVLLWELVGVKGGRFSLVRW